MLGHPDPLVPCQSFHFGPRFQQDGGGNTNLRPHIAAEVSSVVIEHVPYMATTSQNSAQGTNNYMSIRNQGSEIVAVL